MRPSLWLTIPFLAACAATHSDGPTVTPDADGALVVELDGQPFARVVTGDGAQSPYVYPLIGPGGVRMTRGFPMDPHPGEEHDHPHHRSLWLTHGDVNGVDFWHRGERSGTIVTVDRRIVQGDQRSTVELELRWEDDAGKALLEETRRLTFEGAGDERWIDVESELRVLRESVVFGDTKEGSMALRLHPALRLEGEHARGQARNSEGHEGKAVWGKRARWVHYFGPIDGAPVGVALFDHPNNPRHPTWWHARAYGLVAANPFGAHDFEGLPAGTGDMALAPRTRVRLCYRVLLYAGERTPAQLEQQFAAFAGARQP